MATREDRENGARTGETEAQEVQSQLMRKSSGRKMPARIAVEKKVRSRDDEARAAVNKLNGGEAGGQRIRVDMTGTYVDPKTGRTVTEAYEDVARPMNELEIGEMFENDEERERRQRRKAEAEEMRRRKLEEYPDVFELARMAR